jgi:fatty-acid desaturase
MGYHRLLTHRSYKPPKWIEYLLAKATAIKSIDVGEAFASGS